MLGVEEGMGSRYYHIILYVYEVFRKEIVEKVICFNYHTIMEQTWKSESEFFYFVL